VIENGLLKLDYLSILEINGKGSYELLQGQITADMDKVSNSNSVIGAICDIKGRAVSSFVVCKETSSDNNFLLIGNTASIEVAHEVLNKYKPFYDTELTFASTTYIYGIDEETLIENFPDTELTKSFQNYGDAFRVHYLDKQYHLLLTKKRLEKNVLKPEESQVLWLIDDINNLNMEITQEISGEFTPHELGYPATARIDFEKGCYTGQEIVARMHYRAKKLPTVLLKNSSHKYEIGTKIQSEDNKSIGIVLTRAQSSDGYSYLLSMNKSFEDQSFVF
jgi:folate-binding protein YgfZ|tara:strand:+ start:5773 stop:6606 length:834 start_codon:yes stop_codon:yes gene_type:complete